MAFFGKNFKKTRFENLDELLEANNAPEAVRTALKNTDGITRFEKNPDGSIQYIVTKDGDVKMSQKFSINSESDFVTQDGTKTKLSSQLNGNRLDSVMNFPDGSKIHIERVFENNTMKYTLYKEGVDVKGSIFYEVV